MANKEDNSEKEARQLIAELRILEGTAESLQSRMNYVNAFWNEANSANMTLEGIEKEEKNVPLFVPIGGGSYIKAKLDETDKVVYGVGAGIAIEKTLKEAKEGVSGRIAELNKARMALEQQFSQVLKRIQEDQSRLQELTSALREQERNQDV
jgi:prefoldin alpha subunit